MFPIIFVLFLSVSANEQPCEDVYSVEISNGTFYKDSWIQYDIVYPANYVYTKNVSGEIKTFGCLCKLKDCFRKCCPLGSAMIQKKCTKTDDLDLILNDGLELYDGTILMRKKKIEETGFGLVFGRPHHVCYLEDSKWFIQENGNLYVKLEEDLSQTYGPDKYCIDNFVFIDSQTNASRVELNALICYTEKPDNNHYGLSSTCMLISCFFIILTVAVYAWLPELRNLHGMVLMAYLLSFFVGFLFLASMQILLLFDKINREMCTGFTFVIYFALLAAFFWLNIMCYDIWWTFSGKRSMSSHPSSPMRRFLAYGIYAFGMPMLLTILLSLLEFAVPSETSRFLPRIRQQGCFLHGRSKFIYLYVPMIVLCVANLIFFTLTAIKIAKIKRQTQLLNKKDKQRFTLYIKLFIVMGVNWILEVISSFYPYANYIWQFTDAYNVLVGVVIFLIFVCKGKTWNKIKDRYRHMMGLQPMSRTQTTSTSMSTRTYSQSKDEMQMSLAKH